MMDRIVRLVEFYRIGAMMVAMIVIVSPRPHTPRGQMCVEGVVC